MTLVQLFTAIANAIRAKKGTSGTITASNFPTEIAGIQTGHLTNEEYQSANDTVDDILENTTVPSGTLNITENGEYDVTNYVEANVNIVNKYNIKVDTSKSYNYNGRIGSLITEVGDIDTSNMTSMKNMFSLCMNLQTVPLLDTSLVTDMSGMFSSDSALTSVSLFNTSNVTDMSSMFTYCTALKEIPLFDTSSVTNMSNMFNYCSNLETVPLLNTSSVTNMSYMFQSCLKLNDTSLDNILQMCINATSYTGTKTLFSLGMFGIPLAKFQNLPHYQAFLDAGWTYN